MKKLTMVINEELVVNRIMKRRLAKLSGVQTMCLEARVPWLYRRPFPYPALVPNSSTTFHPLHLLQTTFLPLTACVVQTLAFLWYVNINLVCSKSLILQQNKWKLFITSHITFSAHYNTSGFLTKFFFFFFLLEPMYLEEDLRS